MMSTRCWRRPLPFGPPALASASIAAILSLLAVGFPPRMSARAAVLDPPEPRVVWLTAPDARRPAEVSVAINPTNPDHVVAVMLQGGRPGEPRVTNHAYVSLDGGLTWAGAAATNADGRVRGDDAVVFAGDGTAYESFIAFDGIRVDRPERASSGIFVRSTRDGVTWNAPVAVVDHVNSAIPFEDKPWIGVDRSAASPHRGNAYVAWTRFDVYGSRDPAHRSRIMLSRSRDGGRTFSVPIEISDVTGDAIDSDGTVEGAVPAVGPNGELYVAWAGPEGLVIDRSLDGGFTFARDTKVAALAGGWDLPVAGLERHNGMPVTAVDGSRGPHRGTVYVSFIDDRNGDPDVFVARSSDGGATWSAPVRVNDDARGAVQMFAWMAVDPVDGSVNLVFHDRRDAPDARPMLTGVTLARSTDGGRTFSNLRLPVDGFDCCGKAFFGDYSGIDAYGGGVVAAFPVLDSTGTQRILAAVVRP